MINTQQQNKKCLFAVVVSRPRKGGHEGMARHDARKGIYEGIGRRGHHGPRQAVQGDREAEIAVPDQPPRWTHAQNDRDTRKSGNLCQVRSPLNKFQSHNWVSL